MRTPEYAGQFKRDYKREKKGRHGALLESALGDVLVALLLTSGWNLVTTITPWLERGGEFDEPNHPCTALLGCLAWFPAAGVRHRTLSNTRGAA
jgi:hypothetical protein